VERWIDRHRWGLAALSGALVLVVLLLGAWSRRIGALPGEYSLTIRLFERTTPAGLPEAASFFVGFGEVLVVLLTVGLGTALTWRRLGPRYALLIPAAAASALAARALKALIGPTQIYAEFGTPELVAGNLPSGHMTYATAVFGLIAVLALLRGRWIAGGLALIPVPAMGVSLVVIGGHVPSDVLAGCALGLAWLLALLVVAIPSRGDHDRAPGRVRASPR
jgi:membrane-associated phospholipid phosphatase